MSKVFHANCTADGIVQCEGFDIPEATLLGEGKSESEGVLLMDEDRPFYIPKNISDLNTTLEKISQALDKIASGIEKLDTAGYVIAVVGDATGTPAGPFATGEIADIRSLKGELDDLRGALK